LILKRQKVSPRAKEEKVMEKIKRFLRKTMDILLFVVMCKGPIAEEGISEGYLDFSGQGRNEYGR
jgi:hypothetical protein